MPGWLLGYRWCRLRRPHLTSWVAQPFVADSRRRHAGQHLPQSVLQVVVQRQLPKGLLVQRQRCGLGACAVERLQQLGRQCQQHGAKGLSAAARCLHQIGAGMRLHQQQARGRVHRGLVAAVVQVQPACRHQQQAGFMEQEARRMPGLAQAGLRQAAQAGPHHGGGRRQQPVAAGHRVAVQVQAAQTAGFRLYRPVMLALPSTWPACSAARTLAPVSSPETASVGVASA